jgi:hypothetical protein
MNIDLEKPLLDFNIDSEMQSLEKTYKTFLEDIESIDKKLSQIEDKRDYDKISSVYAYSY